MIIFLLDDNPQDLAHLQDEVSRLFPHETLKVAMSASQLMDHARHLKASGQAPRYLFTETSVGGEDGVAFAAALRQLYPSVCVMFCTANPDRALDAWEMHAQGYIMKPVTLDKIYSALDAMNMLPRHNASGEACLVHMQTFGQFEVFADDHPIHFERSKAKELLAYLVDRRGGAVTNADIAAALWENDRSDTAQKDYVRKLISSLRKSLRDVHAEDILIRDRNQLRLDVSKVSCDLYDFLRGDARAISAYLGEYMTSYSWAETTNGALQMREG